MPDAPHGPAATAGHPLGTSLASRGRMTPWDRLMDRLDELVHGGTKVGDDVELELTELLLAAMRDGVADRELDPADSGRWLATLLRVHRELEPDERRADDALSTLRVIVTRWLHPGRLGQAPPVFDRTT